MKIKPERGSFHILVTDTNHHVRDFLKRELEKEGYTISCADKGIDACNLICASTSPDLVILDPELFSPDEHHALKKLLKKKSSPRILLHTYDDVSIELESAQNSQIIIKSASSIGSIKETVKACFKSKAGS